MLFVLGPEVFAQNFPSDDIPVMTSIDEKLRLRPKIA